MSERNCVECGKPLEGRQVKFCSNRCKQVAKNRSNNQAMVKLLADNARLTRKVRRLENKIKKLEAA